MQWLTEIFASSSDQARLATTIIAALIAVCVVLLNQWHNSRRARKEKLIEKIEEMYLVVRNMQLHTITLTDVIYHYYFDNKKVAISVNSESFIKLEDVHRIFEEIGNEGSKAYMLSGLYFNTEPLGITDILTNSKKLQKIFCDSESYKEYEKNSKDCDAKIASNFYDVYRKLSKIMRETMH